MTPRHLRAACALLRLSAGHLRPGQMIREQTLTAWDCRFLLGLMEQHKRHRPLTAGQEAVLGRAVRHHAHRLPAEVVAEWAGEGKGGAA